MPGIDSTGSTEQLLQAAFDPTTQSLKVSNLGSLSGTNAPSNAVGYVQSSSLNISSAISLTSGTPANVIASIVIPAGSWLISAAVGFVPAATTSVTAFIGAVSTTSATIPPANTELVTDGAGQIHSHLSYPASVPGANSIDIVMPSYPLFTATSVTVYLVAQATFTVSTISAFGVLNALRIR